ncbi:MAG: hypothetical protein ACTHK2_19425 [Dokdonella sp.]|uniref:hypothetical protein n=1 Tax=Dokdonella sp. TaxID=2291710 RepID=UPI003F8204E8
MSIVSPSFAAFTASRKLPAPESLQLVTGMFAAGTAGGVRFAPWTVFMTMSRSAPDKTGGSAAVACAPIGLGGGTLACTVEQKSVLVPRASAVARQLASTFGRGASAARCLTRFI